MSAGIHKLTMPKWGLSMTEGKVVAWLVDEGAEVDVGAEVVEIETEKVSSVLEAPHSGVLRRVAGVGVSVPVAGLIGAIADASVSSAELDVFVAAFQENFVPEEVEEEAAGPAPEIVEANGKTLRYLQRGEGGEPAILIHGFGGDLNNWLFNHEALSANRSVYALDLPGHGSSSKQLESGSVAELTGTLTAFMDAIGVPRAHLVGHSMGGAIALDLALNHPGRALSLVPHRTRRSGAGDQWRLHRRLHHGKSASGHQAAYREAVRRSLRSEPAAHRRHSEVQTHRRCRLSLADHRRCSLPSRPPSPGIA